MDKPVEVLLLLHMEQHYTDFGRLSVIEFNQLNFIPVRVFFIDDVPSGAIRGGHGHHVTWQFLVITSGKIKCNLIDKFGNTNSIELNDQVRTLLIPPKTWAEQIYLEEGSHLTVFASHNYDPNDYFVEKPTKAEF